MKETSGKSCAFSTQPKRAATWTSESLDSRVCTGGPWPRLDTGTLAAATMLLRWHQPCSFAFAGTVHTVTFTARSAANPLLKTKLNGKQGVSVSQRPLGEKNSLLSSGHVSPRSPWTSVFSFDLFPSLSSSYPSFS